MFHNYRREEQLSLLRSRVDTNRLPLSGCQGFPPLIFETLLASFGANLYLSFNYARVQRNDLFLEDLWRLLQVAHRVTEMCQEDFIVNAGHVSCKMMGTCGLKLKRDQRDFIVQSK